MEASTYFELRLLADLVYTAVGCFTKKVFFKSIKRHFILIRIKTKKILVRLHFKLSSFKLLN